MPCCKKSLSVLLRILLLAWLFAAPALADSFNANDGIYVNKFEIRESDGDYQLATSYDIKLNFVVQQALSRGIPLYFVGEFSLTRARWNWLDSAQRAMLRNIPRYLGDKLPQTRWNWLDETIFKGEQTFKLSYNVLTGRYRISRGALFQNFTSLDDALSMLSRQSSTAIPAGLMKKEGSYIAASRLRLDIDQLPKPLQVNALTDNDWTLDSDWHRWMINPEEIASHHDSKPE